MRSQGKGNGRIQLALTYKDMESYLPNEPKDATMGILIVRVRTCKNREFWVGCRCDDGGPDCAGMSCKGQAGQGVTAPLVKLAEERGKVART